MVITRGSEAKKRKLEDPVMQKIVKKSSTEVVIPKSRVPAEYLKKFESELKKLKQKSEVIEPPKYPKRVMTYTPKMLKFKIQSCSGFIKNKEIVGIKWAGVAQHKYTRQGINIKVFSKAMWGKEILRIGDIVKLKTISRENLGQITFLFEENSRKKAEIRLFYPFRKEFVETYEYTLTSLEHVFEKINFTPENGYICAILRDKSGKTIQIDEQSRLERSLLHSKFALQVCENSNPLHHSITLLTFSCAPSTLIGRSQEKEEILSFLTTSLDMGHSSNSLYMCGMPGTGKTATFLYSIDLLSSSSDYSSAFSFIHINCMKLSKPQEIYNLICRQLLNKKKSGNEALEEINKYIRSANKPVCVILLIDELDALLNKKQDVLYNLFNWTNVPNSNFIVAGIANTMDLSEKFIHKVSSRMGNKQIVFAPYSRDQLHEIITKRLKDVECFTAEAILFCAAKIASYSGDARRAFSVCKKAAFLALEQKDSKVGIEHIQKAFKQLFASIYVQAIQALPIYLKVLLACLCIELKNNASETANVERLCTRLNSYCDTILNIKTLSLKQVQVIVCRLASLHLVSIEQDSVKLLISPDDVIEGIKSEETLAKLDTFLQNN